MHHPGPSPAAASHVPAGGIRADAGMLAEGTTHEEEHQGHPHPPPELGQGIACLPGYPRLGPFSLDPPFPMHSSDWPTQQTSYLPLGVITLLSFVVLTVLTRQGAAFGGKQCALLHPQTVLTRFWHCLFLSPASPLVSFFLSPFHLLLWVFPAS